MDAFRFGDEIGKDVVKVRGELVSFGSEKIIHHMDNFSVNEVTFFFVSAAKVWKVGSEGETREHL